MLLIYRISSSVWWIRRQPLSFLFSTNTVLCGHTWKKEWWSLFTLSGWPYWLHAVIARMPQLDPRPPKVTSVYTGRLSSWQQVRCTHTELTLWCWLVERHRFAIGQSIHQCSFFSSTKLTASNCSLHTLRQRVNSHFVFMGQRANTYSNRSGRQSHESWVWPLPDWPGDGWTP